MMIINRLEGLEDLEGLETSEMHSTSLKRRLHDVSVLF